MANGKTHQLAGVVTGVMVSLLDDEAEKTVIHNPVAAGFIGGLLGKLPDFLEPATNPNHRQFFHSVVVFGGVCIGLKKAYDWEPNDDVERLLRVGLLIAAGAYISHLALDSLTTKSLPLVGRL